MQKFMRWFIVLLLGLPLNSFGQQARLRALGFATNQFRIELHAEPGEKLVFEGSSTLVEWFQLQTILPDQPISILNDPRSAATGAHFYRIRATQLSLLRPAAVDLLAGDQEVFFVEGGSTSTNWVWTVNGIVGGNDTVGRVLSPPSAPWLATFKAPLTGGTQTVEICAEDVAASQKQCGTVRIHPRPTTYLIQPTNPTLGLAEQVKFRAGAIIEGVGFVSLRQIWWKLNSVIGGDAQLGMLDLNGTYESPLIMPTNLPQKIMVGFSFSVPGPVAAETSVRLAVLTVKPNVMDSLTIGRVATLAPALNYSDGTTRALPTNEVEFKTGLPGSALVRETGDVILGLTAGRAIISVTHPALNLTTVASAFARPDVRLEIHDVHVPSGDPVRIKRTGISSTLPITEIEVTSPGIVLSIAPDIFQFRGTFNSSGPRLRVPGSPQVKARGLGANIKTYNQAQGIIQPTGSTAIVEESSGVIQIGDIPGSGTVTFSYNDGVVFRETSVLIIFSRPEIRVQTRASLTFKTNESYVTEPISFTVNLTNRLNASKYVARTPIRIRETSGALFHALIPNNGAQAQQFFPTSEIQLDVPSTLRDPFTAENYSPFVIPGQVEFQIWPDEAGVFEYEVAIANDSLAIPQKVTYVVKRPSLQLPYNPSIGITKILSPPRTNTLLGSWENFDQGTNDPSGVSLVGPFNSITSLTGEKLLWTLRNPEGVLTEAPYDPQGIRPWFRKGWRMPGAHALWLRSSVRPEVRTEELLFTVNGPAASGRYDVIGDITYKPSSSGTAPANRLAALRILAPLENVWIPGVPIDIVLQTIDAAGTPRRVGKVTVTENRFAADPGRVERTTNSFTIAGCDVSIPGFGGYVLEDVVTGETTSRIAFADQDGRIHLRLTMPVGTPPGDVAISFSPVTQTRTTVPQAGDLPVELIQRRDGFQTTRDNIVIDVATAQLSKDIGLQSPALLLGGRGLIVNPASLVLPTDRVRKGVTEGWLPAGYSDLVAEVRGTTGWGDALSKGLPTVDFGPGLTLVSQSVSNEVLVVRLSANAAYFTNAAALGPRDIAVTFADGSRWQTRLTVAKYSIERLASQADRNLPLNAAYGLYESRTSVGRHPDGTVTFMIKSSDTVGAGARLDLELRPSIQACWDRNENGIADRDEDVNKDGKFDELDDAGGLRFRGLLPVNPLIGFHRDTDPVSGRLRVRQLRYGLLSPVDSQFTIYGDVTDRRRLDESGVRFLEGFDPDLLPDFVSRSANGEMLLAWAGPTLVDAIRFTAYNFITTAHTITGDPSLDLDAVKTNATKAYDLYGSLNPDQPISALARGTKVTSPVSVYVDHEASLEDLQNLAKDPNGYFDVKFYAGMLDQLFQQTFIFTSKGTKDIPLVRDDRVRPYLPRGRPETGSQRFFFGMDLDGVVYDPGWLNFPKPSLADVLLVRVPEGAFQDKDPNSPGLLSFGTVEKILGGDTNRTAAGLIRRVGGTSGGFVQTQSPLVGGMQVEAKTPGADFPGLHAGYLVWGKPEDFIDFYNNQPEDDIRDVLLRREGEPGEVAGTPIVREKVALGYTQPRYALGFAQNEDKKEPIKTAARVSSIYRVTTDPEGVIPDDPKLWKISPAIVVRERPIHRTHPMDLIVTSQSDGNEGTMKLVADAVVDFTLDITAGALLASMSGGLSLECTADSIRDTATAAVIDLAIGYASGELFKDYTEGGRDQMIEIGNSALRGGFEVPIAGITIPSYADIREAQIERSLLNTEEILKYGKPRPRQSVGYNLAKGAFPDICSLLTAPIDHLKDVIKDSYSAETFGGLGSAEAFGMKLAAITIPKSARVGTNGIYTASFSVSRRVDVQAEEPTAVYLRDLPYQELFGEYPYVDMVTDDEFLAQLQAKTLDPVVGEKAAQMLRDIGRKSLWRSQSYRPDPYRHYKMRCWNVPELSGMLAPGMQLNERFIGNFALTPGETEIPVATAAVVTVSRSNENSTSRARLRSPGVELLLRGGVIPDPRAPH